MTKKQPRAWGRQGYFARPPGRVTPKRADFAATTAVLLRSAHRQRVWQKRARELVSNGHQTRSEDRRLSAAAKPLCSFLCGHGALWGPAGTPVCLQSPIERPADAVLDHLVALLWCRAPEVFCLAGITAQVVELPVFIIE